MSPSHPCRAVSRVLAMGVLLAGIGAAWLGLPALPASTAAAQTSGAIDPGEKGTPIEIEADQGIEWRRDDKVYIARGNATATRGDSRVVADRLTARYRDTADGGSEIWQVEAEGNVRMTSPGRTVRGDKAVYNLDQGILRVTGDNLRIETKEETVTARDSLEYHERPQIILARGDAVAIQGDRRVRADLLTGHLERREDGSYALVRLEANGNVEVKTTNTFARSQKGDYDLSKDFMTLTGDVKITSGQNQFNGEYAEMDVETGVSHLLGSPSGDGRVKSLVMPSSRESNE